jgi:hypothetical protein
MLVGWRWARQKEGVCERQSVVINVKCPWTDRPPARACLCLSLSKDRRPRARVDLGNVTKTTTDYYLLVRRMAAGDRCTRFFFIIIICTSHTNTSIAYPLTHLLTPMHAREMSSLMSAVRALSLQCL